MERRKQVKQLMKQQDVNPDIYLQVHVVNKKVLLIVLSFYLLTSGEANLASLT